MKIMVGGGLLGADQCQRCEFLCSHHASIGSANALLAACSLSATSRHCGWKTDKSQDPIPRSLPLRKLQHYDEDLNRAQLAGISDVFFGFCTNSPIITEMLCRRSLSS